MARKTFECPNCGADVPVGKKGCRECGSDASTGWMDSEEIDYQSIDIPDGYGPTDEVKQGVGRTQLVAVLLLLLLAGIVTLALLN
jgi:hypothetical protein